MLHHPKSRHFSCISRALSFVSVNLCTLCSRHPRSSPHIEASTGIGDSPVHARCGFSSSSPRYNISSPGRVIMFQSVPRRGSPHSAAPVVSAVAAAQEDDDNISLTSTIVEAHDPEEEFVVEDIHLERTADDGSGNVYLVEWAGWPLYQCTWEPASNLGEELLEEWQEKQEQQQRGQVEAWTWDTWMDIQGTAEREHLARHRRRNARRKKMGLPLTEPIDEPETVGGEESQSIKNDDSSSEEVVEDRTVAAAAAERRHSPGRPKKSSATPAGLPNPSSTAHRQPPGHVPPRPGLARKLSKGSAPPPRQERPSSTGYQGTARRPSLTSANTGSRNRGIPSAPRKAAGAKVHTAKKSAAVSDASNIFIGGKIRKTRTGLRDAVSDPTKEPKLFTRLRHRRLAEKNSRDKEDRPPPILPNLFANFDSPSKRKSTGVEPALEVSRKQTDILSPAAGNTGGPNPPEKQKHAHANDDDAPMFADEPESMGTRTLAEPASATFETQNRIPSPVNRRSSLSKQPKKKKSVRFHENDTPTLADGPAVAMEIDSPAAEGIAEQTVATPRTEIPTRVVQTKLWLGSVHDSEPILSSMDGVPLTSEGPWLSEFLRTEILRVEYTCSANDFLFQRANLWYDLLCSGTVASGPGGPALETAATNLREGGLALYHTAPSYSLILYPASSGEWRSFMAEQGNPPSNEGGSGLKYCIFRSPEDVGPFLRHPAAKVPEKNTLAPEKNLGSYEEKLLWRLFDFDYQALLPPPRPGSKNSTHHCFLLFPRNRSDWLAVLARWIRLSSPDCRIYTGYDAGAWSSFCDATSSASGIVIVHELLSLSLRRIPDLWNPLHHYRDTYWCFSEAVQPQPLFPSLTVSGDVVQPGDIRFAPLFPIRPKRRLVLLLTPSFLCSEPKRAYELLQWFHDVWAARLSPTCRLVSAHNLYEHLEDLALQKSREREDVLAQYRHNVAQAEITANVKALSQDDCTYRFKALSLALELHHLRVQQAGPSNINEDLSPLQYADPSIDPNDEQSLVNWFGWWSSLRLDQFRGFHVVGSNSSIKFNGSQKGSSIISIPKYSRSTINDPDLVREEVQRMNEHVGVVGPLDVHGDTKPAALAAPPSGPSRRPSFQSRYLASENGSAFTAELDLVRKWAPRTLTLYIFPVAWTDLEEAVDFGDIREEFQTMTRWWDFPFPFVPEKNFNTYVGFFYTLQDSDLEVSRACRTPARHPWIGVYRPVDLAHRARPLRGCELIIWDPAARDRFPGAQPPREEDLAYGQRMLIRLIREKTSVKNPGSSLEKVWYGGFEHPPNVDPPHPVDVALASLELLVRDPQQYLPRYAHELSLAGYRIVRQQVSPSSTGGLAPAPASAPMDVDSPGHGESKGGDEEDARIIFHPPRGDPQRTTGPTRCVNHLYEKATAARKEDRGRTRMRYDFPVTTDWYDVQRSEGRGFEHVHVAPWESVFNMLKIQVPSSGSTHLAPKAAQQENAPDHFPSSVDMIMIMKSY